MTKRQENKLTMYEGLLSLLQANSARISGAAGFPETVTELTDKIGALKAKSAEVDTVAVGKTATKESAKESLIEALMPVCNMMCVIGKKKGDEELKELGDVPESRMNYMRDTELAKYGKTIAERAAAISAELTAKGITAAMVADLAAKADGYNTAIGAKESSIVDRKGARQTLGDLFNEVDELLTDEVDRFMELLRSKEPEFYNKYFAARVVKETGVRHRPATAGGSPGEPDEAKTPPAAPQQA